MADKCYRGSFNDIPLSMQAKQEIHNWVSDHFMSEKPE
jgi:hypothetical protein